MKTVFTVWLPGKGSVSTGTWDGKTPIQPGDHIRVGNVYYPITEVQGNNRVVINKYAGITSLFGERPNGRILVAS